MVSLFVRQRLRPFPSKENTEDLFHLKELIESGKVTPVIDRMYPLSKSAEALAYVAEGEGYRNSISSVTWLDAGSPGRGALEFRIFKGHPRTTHGFRTVTRAKKRSTKETCLCADRRSQSGQRSRVS
jgi:hypothetical protein